MLSQYFSQPEKRIQTIIELAIAKNITELNRFISKHGNSIDEYHEDQSAIFLLAKENKREAVMFLIDHYRASVKLAVRGAIQGKNYKLMEELLLLNSFVMNAAVYEAALINDAHLTFYLLEKGADKNKALYGAGLETIHYYSIN